MDGAIFWLDLLPPEVNKFAKGKDVTVYKT